MRRLFITYLLAFVAIIASAQVKVESEISSVEMLVGQQVQLTVSATAGEDAVVEFPQEATLPEGIEYLGTINLPDEAVADGMVAARRRGCDECHRVAAVALERQGGHHLQYYLHRRRHE